MANPNGVAQDRIRRCYAAWMRVPDHPNPIRVRWYRVPDIAPGAVQTTLYSSSDFDERPDINPAVGEQGGLRDPFNDWRDCAPPPWDMPPLTDCNEALAPAWEQYRFRTNNWAGSGNVPLAAGDWVVSTHTPCTWQTWPVGANPPASVGVGWILSFTAGGSAALTLRDQGNFVLAVYAAASPVDPHGPIRFDRLSTHPSVVTSPDYITVRGETDMPAPIGMSGDFYGGSPPARWLLCDGSAVSRATYHLLFAVIGSVYGDGDGVNTFNLPDRRGRSLIGTSPGTLGADRPSARDLGDTGGEEAHKLSKPELPSHEHTINDPDHTHAVTTDSSATAGTSLTTLVRGSTSPTNINTLQVTSDPTGVVTDPLGDDEAHNNMPPFLAVLPCIYAGA